MTVLFPSVQAWSCEGLTFSNRWRYGDRATHQLCECFMDDRDGFVQLHLAKQKKQKLRFSYSETRKQSVVLDAMAE